MNEELYLEAIEAIKDSRGYDDWFRCAAKSITDIFGEFVGNNYIKHSPFIPSIDECSKEDQLNIMYYYAYVFPEER